MGASEYWDAAEIILDDGYQDGPDWMAETTDKLIAINWVRSEDRQKVIGELGKHSQIWGRPDDDYDFDCDCGKWLETDQYEWPDHVSSVLECDLKLMADPDWVPRPPSPPRKPGPPPPQEMQFQRAPMFGPSTWLDRVEAGESPVDVWRADDVSEWEFRDVKL